MSRPERTQQVTDGLADSVWPVWDASGKYLWFFAATDLGLRSQWLDMTSYDHEENFGLYLAVLKKGEPSPILPESDEDHGVGSAPAARRWSWRTRRSGCGRRSSERQLRAARGRRSRADRFRRIAAADHQCAKRSRAAIFAASRGSRRDGLLSRSGKRRTRGWRRTRRSWRWKHVAALSSKRSPGRDVRQRSGGL